MSALALLASCSEPDNFTTVDSGLKSIFRRGASCHEVHAKPALVISRNGVIIDSFFQDDLVVFSGDYLDAWDQRMKGEGVQVVRISAKELEFFTKAELGDSSLAREICR